MVKAKIYRYNTQYFFSLFAMFSFLLGTQQLSAQQNNIAKKIKEHVIKNNDLSCHTIIAFDNALDKSLYRVVLYDGILVKRAINSALEFIDSECGGEKYYSMANYGLGTQDRNIDNMARVIKSRGRKICWIEREKFERIYQEENLLYRTVFIDGLRFTANHGSPFSLQTGAKSFVLKSIGSQQVEQTANKTFLLMVTDDRYNGNDDINKELSNFNNPYINKNEYLKNCYGVSDIYSFRYKKKINIIGDYGVSVYEVVPSQSVSLSSVVNFPSNLGIHRVNGGYKLKANFETIDSHYKIVKIEIVVKNRMGDSFTVESKGEGYRGAINSYDQNVNGFMELKLPKELLGDTVDVTLEGELFLNDSIYEGVRLSAKDRNFKRLRMCYSLPLNDEAKVLGILPLPDVLWMFTDNVTIAMAVWNALSLLLVVLVVLGIGYIYVKRKTTSRPTIDDVSIKLTR